MHPEDPIVYIVHSPSYTYMHSGVRCLHLLCHHLNRLGYRSYINTQVINPNFETPVADTEVLERLRREGSVEIVIYPEVTNGNPLNAERVVRYLLNKPGYLTGVGVEGFGLGDFFIHYADEFLPPGLKSLKVRIPLVDQDVYRPPEQWTLRDLFAVYTVRYQPDMASFPAWVRNVETISRARPREPPALVELYHRSRALISGERTSAINEAIHCGCPVIIIPNEEFEHRPVVEFYGGHGLVVGFDEVGLERAAQSLDFARTRYRMQFQNWDEALHSFVKHSRKHFGL